MDKATLTVEQSTQSKQSKKDRIKDQEMKKVLCFISDEMADFEVTLALQILRNTGCREIIALGYDLTPVRSQAGFTHLPDLTLASGCDLQDVEGLIIPGGPIRPQRDELTRLICKMHAEKKLLAAICFGPQYLGRAGILDQHRFTTSCTEETIKSLQVPDPYPRTNYVEARVVRDQHVITAKGGAFVDFAFAIADYLEIYSEDPDQRASFYNEIVDRFQK
jgi:putative intracellular protease/amidase